MLCSFGSLTKQQVLGWARAACVSILTASVLAAPVAAQSAQQSAEIKDRLEKMKRGGMGCTASKREIRKLRKKYPDYHFAFAGRKAPTITGIKGCGYAWNTDKAKAFSVAMEFCKEWEVNYGTANGKWTCRFQN